MEPPDRGPPLASRTLRPPRSRGRGRVASAHGTCRDPAGARRRDPWTAHRIHRRKSGPDVLVGGPILRRGWRCADRVRSLRPRDCDTGFNLRAIVRVRFDGGGWQNPTVSGSSWSDSIDTTKTFDGDHLIEAQSVLGGRESAIVSRDVIVANAKPGLSILSPPLIWGILGLPLAALLILTVARRRRRRRGPLQFR